MAGGASNTFDRCLLRPGMSGCRIGGPAQYLALMGWATSDDRKLRTNFTIFPTPLPIQGVRRTSQTW